MDVVGAPRELVALGGVLDAATLRAAYRNALFPWPPDPSDAATHERTVRRLARRGEVPVLPGTPQGHLVPWVSPQPRAVLLTERLHVPRTLRQTLRRSGWRTTMDTCFSEVMRRCADRPDGSWITAAVLEGYTALHREGGAHSVEVWADDRLVGGLYGVLSGRVFSGESMFFTESAASKVAVVDLVHRLREADVPLLDTQQESDHLTTLGQVLVHRADYVAAVRSLQASTPELPQEPREVERYAS
jgi:leucyl/phenylalanyl-tRNA--protein transferase